MKYTYVVLYLVKEKTECLLVHLIGSVSSCHFHKLSKLSNNLIYLISFSAIVTVTVEMLRFRQDGIATEQ